MRIRRWRVSFGILELFRPYLPGNYTATSHATLRRFTTPAAILGGTRPLPASPALTGTSIASHRRAVALPVASFDGCRAFLDERLYRARRIAFRAFIMPPSTISWLSSEAHGRAAPRRDDRAAPAPHFSAILSSRGMPGFTRLLHFAAMGRDGRCAESRLPYQRSMLSASAGAHYSPIDAAA